jgi:hypothetical protein
MQRRSIMIVLAMIVSIVLSACGGAGPLAVQSVTLSKTEGGAAVTAFSSTDRTFYATIELNRIETGLTAKVIWLAVDTTAGQNIEVAQKEFTSLLVNVINANIEMPRDWPIGKYKLDIYLNGSLAKTVEFPVN